MKVKICFFKKNISWSKDWIFLGKSFFNLEKAEKKIKGKRIKINNDIHKIFEEDLKNYIKWTEDQRELHKDSIYWWMTDLSSKNNLSSDFYLFICQILAVNKIIKSKKFDELLVVCDDMFLARTLNKFLSQNNIETHLLSKKNYLISLAVYKFKIVLNFIFSIISIFSWMLISKIFNRKNQKPSGEVILLHNFTNISALKKSNLLTSRYFPFLQDFFKKKKLKVYYLTWFNNFWKDRIKVFKILKKQSGFIVEEFISLNDLKIAISNFFKSKKIIETCKNYRDINLQDLLKRESLKYQIDSISHLKFWLYRPAIKKWAQNCSSLICIDHYENMVFEHALIASIRNLNIKKKIVYGYHHTLSSKEFTAWHSLETEWNSSFKPDFVISSGNISKNFLTSQGTPSKKIINGPALRYHNILSGPNHSESKKDINKILFPLSQIKDSSRELINKIFILGKMLSKTDYELVIKPHPNFSVSKILETNSNLLSNNISISDKSVDELLDKCYFSVFMATGAAYNAILKGSIAFTLESELNLADNYLDIFQDKHKYLESHDLLSLKNLLIELKNDKIKLINYQGEFLKLKTALINGFNEVNNERLEIFSSFKNGN